MRVLLDADPIVYAAGFVSEDVYYEGFASNEGGEPIQFRVQTGEEYAALKKKYTEIEKTRFAIPKPASEALVATNAIINSIKDEIHTLKQVPYKGIAISPFLTGKANYREQIAKQRLYKGNRDKSTRPVHYQRIRDHLEKYWRAKVVDNREADDEVSIQGWSAYKNRDEYVIATIDKDLDQIPGLHYNYRTHVFYEVNEHEALRAFWIQALCGDSGDNVPGCWGIGYKKAAAFIDKMLEQGLSDKDIWYGIVRMYEATAKRPDCPYKEEEAQAIATETAQLVYLQRRAGEVWTPNGIIYAGANADD